jgi:hypothetical protein
MARSPSSELEAQNDTGAAAEGAQAADAGPGEAQGDGAPSEGVKSPLKRPLGLSLRKHMVEAKAAPAMKPAPATKAAPVAKTPIEDAIELTLASASTAVNSAQEIQRLRNELRTVVDGSRRADMTLLFASVFVVVSASLGLTGALVYYQRSLTEFAPVARANRDALLAFAGEINGLAGTSGKIEETVKVSEQALSATTALTEEIRKAIQGFTAQQNALAPKIPPASAYDKPIAALKQSLDELAVANAGVNTRLSDLQQAQNARHQTPQQPVAAPRVEAPKAPPRPATPAATGPDSLIRYP